MLEFVVCACCVVGALAICKMHEIKAHKPFKNKRVMFVAILLLSVFILWAGDKPTDPEEPDPDVPVEPDEPDEPGYEPVEGIRIKLIGRNVDGKFVPITSEWIQTDATNIVEAIEQVTEELDNE